MSTENMGEFIRSLLQKDDSLTDLNNCRNSTSKIGKEVKGKFPEAKTEVLVYPEPSAGYGVHYSLLIAQGDEEILVNAVAAPGFPEYIGSSKAAPPTFTAMKVTPRVI
ncbi:MAG: hypothetical protein ACD_13C00145G0004 [uncultured bacterium]|nr:MAG: hypothetical protein ACD_13C00145G0004 [uncultured bacterium]HAU65369.1 hypothetical protein [Candidatus Woesebacteria bacterium]HCC08917.1 hypothetical protein [Candidatus Woesebacteria bacterium]